MGQYTVTALGGNFELTVEANSSSEAEEIAREELMERFAHTVGTTEYQVYKVTFNHNGTHANVLAPTRGVAERAASDYIGNKVERAVTDSDLSHDAKDLLRDFDTTVKVEDVLDDATHYEINEDGEWVDESL